MIGRPKLKWSDVARKDMEEKQVKIEEAHYRITWILKTRCASPNRENAELEEEEKKQRII